MALETNDPTLKFSDREVNWAYGKMEWPAFQEIQTPDQKRLKLQEYANSEAKIDKVREKLRSSRSSLIDIECFEWVQVSDLRLIYWLKIHLLRARDSDEHSKISAPPTIPFASILPPKEYYDAFIYSVDIWSADIALKRQFLSTLKSKWRDQQKQDENLEWIDRNNEKQTKWVWKYVEKKLFVSLLADDHLIVTDSTENYIRIFTRLYNCQYHPADLRELQGKMKQAWAQQKYRANLKDNNKKQSTYALSNQTKHQLETLAKANNVNLNQMLEYIIDEAYKDRKKRKFQNLPDTEDS